MKKNRIRVTETNLHKYLGKEKYQYQMANETDEVGIVRGLAWTSVGGVTLQIEVNVMPGNGDRSLLTGTTGGCDERICPHRYQLYPFYRTRVMVWKRITLNKHDIHIHIPEGAVPKDGPSAGITMATAILSAVTGRKVQC